MDELDAQVLAQLRIKKTRLKIELERVELAIKAFEELPDELDELEVLPYMLDEIPQSEDDLAVAILMYKPKASAEKKIQYVLSKIGSGDAKRITEYLLNIDKGIKDAEALHERITYVSSRMFRRGEINATKSGKRNVYSLKKRHGSY